MTNETHSSNVPKPGPQKPQGWSEVHLALVKSIAAGKSSDELNGATIDGIISAADRFADKILKKYPDYFK